MEELEQIPPNELDNEISLLYKFANNNNIPTRYVIFTHNNNSIGFLSIEPLLNEMGLKDFLTNVFAVNVKDRKYYSKITPEDAILYYVDLHRDEVTNNPKEFIDSINEIIRNFIKESNFAVPTFRDPDDLQNRSNSWSDQYNGYLQKDVTFLDNILEFQDLLIRQHPINVGPRVLTTVYLDVYPLLKSNLTAPKRSDGVDLFNTAKVSFNIPYIQYNEEEDGKKYYKLYEGESILTMPNYSQAVISPGKTLLPYSLYGSIFKGNAIEETSSISFFGKKKSKNYILMKYNIDKKILKIKSPKNDQRDLIKIVSDALPTLELTKQTRNRIGGYFNIYGMTIIDYAFYDAVLNNSTLSNYLYIDEKTKPIFAKSRVNVKYRSLLEEESSDIAGSGEQKLTSVSPVTISIKQLTATKEDLSASSGNLKEGDIYLKIKFQALSEEIMQQFTSVFARLLSLYKNQLEDPIIDQYQEYIPDLPKPITISQPIPASTKAPVMIIPKLSVERKKSRGAPSFKGSAGALDELKDRAPELFNVAGYSRRCQLESQPKVFDSSVPAQVQELERLKNIPYLSQNGPKIPRPTIEFSNNSPENPKVYTFLCPTDKYPYPGYRDMANIGSYKYLPCCYKTPQENKSKTLSAIGETSIEVPKKTQKTKLQASKMVINEQSFANLPTSLENLLKNYSENTANIGRLGMPFSTNSLIHAICMALDIDDYNDASDKEEFCSLIRSSILAQININVYKQELYDFSEEQIKKDLSDNKIFLDPHLYYRGVEEFFNINIYVFGFVDLPLLNSPSPDHSKIANFILPRFRSFHIRTFRPLRKTVLIFQSTYDVRAQSFPHCDLIIDKNSKDMYFGINMTQLLNTFYNDVNMVNVVSIEKNEPVFRINPYSVLDYIDFLSPIIQKDAEIYQKIDEKGKMRALLLPTNQGNLTICIPPTQPENFKSFDNIAETSLEIAKNIFGDPSKYVVDSNSKITGLWYKLYDIDEAICVPIQAAPSTPQLPRGSPIPLNPVTEQKDAIYIREKYTKDLNFMIQLIIWLYIVGQPITPKEFWQRYMRMGGPRDYDFSKIPRKLPPIESVEEGIKYIKEYVPSFADNRLLLSSKIVYDKLYVVLIDYNNKYSPLFFPTELPYNSSYIEESRWIPPDSIEGYYIRSSDFIQDPYTLIFLNYPDIQMWVEQREIDKSVSFITDKIELKNELQAEPYLYKDVDNKIYLVQNVLGGDFSRAIHVAVFWLDHKINLGFMANPIDVGKMTSEGIGESGDLGKVYAYIKYKLSPSSNPIPFEGGSKGQSQFLQILSYYEATTRGNTEIKRYAALLPVL